MHCSHSFPHANSERNMQQFYYRRRHAAVIAGWLLHSSILSFYVLMRAFMPSPFAYPFLCCAFLGNIQGLSKENKNNLLKNKRNPRDIAKKRGNLFRGTNCIEILFLRCVLTVSLSLVKENARLFLSPVLHLCQTRCSSHSIFPISFSRW